MSDTLDFDAFDGLPAAKESDATPVVPVVDVPLVTAPRTVDMSLLDDLDNLPSIIAKPRPAPVEEESRDESETLEETTPSEDSTPSLELPDLFAAEDDEPVVTPRVPLPEWEEPKVSSYNLSWEGPDQIESSPLLREARALGFGTVTSVDEVNVDTAAVRFLPPLMQALAFARTKDVLGVLVDHIPSPAEVKSIEKISGMIVNVAVAEPDVYLELWELGHADDDTTAPPQLGPALMLAAERGTSDVHLSVGAPPVLRTAGRLAPLDHWPALTATDLEEVAKWIAGDDVLDFNGDWDGAITYADNRWRVSLYRERQSLALALRRIPNKIPELESLQLPGSVVRLSELHQGLVLLSGPTGSGKSTTLASLLDRVNRKRDCHILTIEDPIEYVHQSRTAIVHQREVGEDTDSFATGLRHALRQDPDVILVGEMRDLETMRMALAAAETGHLVFATVHANSAAGVFTRLIDAFPAEQQAQVRTQLASTLKAVVAQQLVPALQKGERQVVCEVLVVNNAVSALVREGKLHEVGSVIESGSEQGMTSMEKSFATFVASKRISREEALSRVQDRQTFEDHLARRPTAGVSNSLADLDDLPEQRR